MSSEALLVLAIAVIAACVFGLYRRATDGRLRAATGECAGIARGRTTLVQFSSPVCAPCATTRRMLADMADREVAHVDLDVTEHDDLVRRFGITRTPTVLVLDAGGAVRHRIVGVPRRADLVAVIQEAS